jgi:putative glutamine amidotransferase
VSRPLIAVTGSSKKSWFGWRSTWLALRRVGAHARRIRPPFHAAQLEGVSGVVIGGGTHIEPSRYEQTCLTDYLYDPERDELEWQVLARATSARWPLLGICRGAQALNVFRGGTLFQDLVRDVPGLVLRNSLLANKRIVLEPDSVVAGLMGVHDLRVNSLHRQGIDRLGERLRVAARDSYGVVQAIETTDAREHLAIGVQWHPEYLPTRAAHQRLFAALADAARSAQVTSARRVLDGEDRAPVPRRDDGRRPPPDAHSRRSAR